MLEFAQQYGIFLAKVVTILAAVLVVIGRLAAAAMRARPGDHERLKVKKLNRRFRLLQRTLEHEMLGEKQWKAVRKADKEAAKALAKDGSAKRRVFVLDFQGDIRASAVTSLREEVTAILSVAKPGDEVLLRLESPGGVVHGYGLAASQLVRLKEAGVKLTASVDKVAASGGYMMACVADQIVAAPFAILGSIGVVAQIPNVHRLLKKHNVDVELHTAGEFKRTLTVLGENTDAGREKFKQELEETHSLFKDFVVTQRPRVDLAQVATGEHWYGQQALGLGLCDRLQTSDAWLMAAAQEADLLELKFEPERHMGQRISGFLGQASARIVDALTDRAAAPILP